MRTLLSTPGSVTPGTGQWLTLNQNGDASVSGSIGSYDGWYAYAFMPDSGGSFVFTVNGPTIDSQLRVYNSAGTAMIGKVDDHWGGTAETATVSLSYGQWYYVVVGGYYSTIGSYTLTVNGVSMYSDSISTPAPAYSGSTSSEISWGGDTDYYTFTAPAQTDSLDLSITPGSGLDTYSVLYSSSGAQLATIDNYASGSADTLSDFAVTAGNTYYLATRSYWRSTTSGSIQVNVDFNPNAGDPPPTVATGGGTRLRLNPFGDVTYSGASIGAGDEYDVYAFLLDISGSTTITVSGVLDAQLRVYNSSGAPLIDTIDAHLGGTAETTTLSLSSGTWYYVGIGGWSMSTGSYSLSINAPNSDVSTFTLSDPTWVGTYSDAISYGGDVDYRSVVAPVGTTSMSVSVVPPAGVDSYVQVYNSAGTVINTFDNGFTGGTDSGTVTVTAGSTYYIATSGYYRDQTGTCGVTVDFAPNRPTGPLVVNGTSGNDTINVTMSGSTLTVTKNGVPTDYVAAAINALTVNGLAGNDTITIGAGVMAATIDGGLGNDSLTGGDGNDSIRGDDGIDTMTGGGGADSILGNTGADMIYGGLGNDLLQAGLGNDSVWGGDGNDSIYGGNDNDWIYGDAGNDYIEGKGKPDTCYGGDGNDTLYGNAGNDWLYGEAGDDWLYGTDSATSFLDRLDGGAGTDRYSADSNDLLTSCELSTI